MEEDSLPLPPVRCLSKEQAAIYPGIGVTLLAQLDVPHIRLGRRCVYDRVDLDAWLDETKGERRRAGKENTWPVLKVKEKEIEKEAEKGFTGDRIPVTGGSMQRFPTAKEYAKALGLKTERMPKPI